MKKVTINILANGKIYSYLQTSELPELERLTALFDGAGIDYTLEY